MSQNQNTTIANAAIFSINNEKFKHTRFVKADGAEKAEKVETKADYTIKGGGRDGQPEVTGSGVKLDKMDKNGNVVRHISVAIKGADDKNVYYNGNLIVSTAKADAVKEGKAGAANLPDFFGTARKTGDETEYRLAGWMKSYKDPKDNNAEKPYISLSLQQPFAGAVDPEPSASTPKDDLPF